MERRGRPRHPDILTPREWEVLALIRESLSNEEIAERLGISIDGVKYHVSEILSKLGLENRWDAARWQPEAERPRWLAAGAPLLFWRGLSFGWLSPALAVGLAVAVAVGVGILVWALLATGGGSETSRNSLGALSAENFGDHLLEALTREGQLFHTTIAQFSVTADGTRQDMYTVEAWLDIEQELIREEVNTETSFEAEIRGYQVTLVVGDIIYYGDEEDIRRGKYRGCLDIGPWLNNILTLVFTCGPQLEGNFGPRRVETDVNYRGRPAIAIMQEGSITIGSPEDPEIREIIRSFYVDRETFLPLAAVNQNLSIAPDFQGEVVSAFENEFLSRSSLPDDFFDPTSIGYVAPTPTNTNPAAALDQPGLGVTIHWLGREFPGEGGLPALRLASSAGSNLSEDGPGNRVTMSYKPAHGPTVELWLWEPAEWERFHQVVIAPGPFGLSCVEQQEIQLEGGRAVIFMGHEPPGGPRTTPVAPSNSDGSLPGVTPIQAPTAPSPKTPGCPSEPFDLFMTVVSFQDTVVTVNAPRCITCARRGDEPDQYDSLAAMEAVVRGLRTRQPGE